MSCSSRRTLRKIEDIYAAENWHTCEIKDLGIADIRGICNVVIATLVMLQVVTHSSPVAGSHRQRREELLEHAVEEEAVRTGHRPHHPQAHLAASRGLGWQHGVAAERAVERALGSRLGLLQGRHAACADEERLHQLLAVREFRLQQYSSSTHSASSSWIIATYYYSSSSSCRPATVVGSHDEYNVKFFRRCFSDNVSPSSCCSCWYL